MAPHADPIRVVVVDDHELFRNGLAKMLSDRGISVAGVASSGEEALESIPRLRPNVVLMDLSLPGMSGVDATRRLLAALPGACVVALTVVTDEETLLQAILAGVHGYLLKDASIDEIVAGIEAAARGEGVISPQLTGNLMRSIRGRFAGTGPLCAADSPRARSARSARRGLRQRRDRGAALHQPVHGEEPCRLDPGKARGSQPSSGRRARGPRVDLTPQDNASSTRVSRATYDRSKMTTPATIVTMPIQRRTVTCSSRKNCPISAIST